MLKKIVLSALFLFAFAATLSADWKTELSQLKNQGFADLASASCKEMNPDPVQIQKNLRLIPDWQSLCDFLREPEFNEAPNKGELMLNNLLGIDGKSRPWVLYVPQNYWHKRATPLLVALHGGVSRISLSEDPIGWAKESEWLKLAKMNGWFALFPYGQEGATWWDEVGMTNIRRQIQLTKHHFNIDDDRVFLAGFSDGASAGFLHAMVRPDDFAAIVALNGHMGVGSLDGDLPTYVTNMTNTPIYTVTTDKDGLYPTSLMAKTIDMAVNCNADILYRQLSGEHNFSYAQTELPLIGDFLNTHSRSKFPTRIFWEASLSEFGRCRWLKIVSVVPDQPADWHKDVNLEMISDRVTIGFVPKKADGGVGVGKVFENTFAMKAGLQEGDVIVEAAGMQIRNSLDLDRAKALVKRGDYLEIKALRASETIELHGNLPEPELYYIFKREAPSAAVEAKFSGNKIEIRGSRVGKIKLFVSPAQFNLKKNFEVIYQEKVAFNKAVTPDPEFILTEFLKNRDRKMLPVAAIELDFSKPDSGEILR